MKRLVLMPFLCLLLVAAPVFAGDPILTLDSGGHQSIIWDLKVTADGRYVVSASVDKTIRVWDTRTKKEVRKILGEVGADSGEIYAIALSPDDR